MAIDAAAVLDFAASLPETGERDYADKAVVFTFRGRGLGYVTNDGRRLYVKCTLDERAALVASRPDVFADWWSAGRFGWVSVELRAADPDEVLELVLEAWRLTAPKRVVAAYDAEG